MNGYSTCIERCNTCWRNDSKLFMRSGSQVFQESGFTSPCFSGQKNMASGAIYKLDSGGHAISFGQNFFSRIHRVKVKQLDSKVSIKKQSDFPGDFFGILGGARSFSAETAEGITQRSLRRDDPKRWALSVVFSAVYTSAYRGRAKTLKTQDLNKD